MAATVTAAPARAPTTTCDLLTGITSLLVPGNVGAPGPRYLGLDGKEREGSQALPSIMAAAFLELISGANMSEFFVLAKEVDTRLLSRR